MSTARFLYALSVPERAVRSLSALTGGLLRELSLVALPPGIRDASLYRATAGITLRFLIQELGDVRNVYPPHDPLARRFFYRYAAGTSVELVSIANFYFSPVWVLAALGDATRVSKALFTGIGEALKAEGLLPKEASFETMDQLLDGLERTGTHLALTVNMPPLDPQSLREEWNRFRANLATLPPARLPSAAEVEQAWRNIEKLARELRRSVFSVSEDMGASAAARVPEPLQWLFRTAAVSARATGEVVGRAFLDHYAEVSKELRKTGTKAYSAAHSRPYLVAAIRNFLPRKQSWLERQLS